LNAKLKRKDFISLLLSLKPLFTTTIKH